MKHRLALLAVSAALALALVLPAAASDAASPAAIKAEKRLALLNAHAGEDDDHVTFLRPIHGYEVVGPRTLLVWETPFKAWLVDMREGAACKDLDRGTSLSLNTGSGSLNTRNGFVRGKFGTYCRLERIREVDVKAWKQAERDAGIRE